MGEWKEYRLGDCIKEVVEKTTENNQYQVLSVTKDGIFSQENFFKKQIASEKLEQYKNCSEQGASIVRRNLDLKALLNISIGIPSIAEQEKIVRILEKVDLIIKKYEELLEEKNRFIKSQFVEIFANVKERKNNTGTTRMGLSQANMVNYEIPIPSLEIQNKYEKIIRIMDRQKFELEKIIENYKNIKKGLMQQLLTGKVKI